MNQQAPSPLDIRPNPTGGKPLLVGTDFPDDGVLAYLNPHRINAPASHALLVAAYTAYDKAGRELGIDATALAQSVDLAEVIRYALDYSLLYTGAETGRTDQVQAAQHALSKLAELMGKRAD